MKVVIILMMLISCNAYAKQYGYNPNVQPGKEQFERIEREREKWRQKIDMENMKRDIENMKRRQYETNRHY